MKQIIKKSLIVGVGMAALVGLVVVPTLSASALTATTTVTATVNSVISVTSGGSVGLSLTPTTGTSESDNSDTVTVNTNDTLGYTLKISAATVNLVSGSNNITPTSNTYAVPNSLSNGNWGYAIPGGTFSATYTALTDQTSTTGKYAGISTTPQTIKTTAVVATNDTTTVWYGAKVANTQPTGAYQTTVTYTATAN